MGSFLETYNDRKGESSRHFATPPLRRHQCVISAVVPRMSFRGENGGDVAKCQLFSQAKKVLYSNLSLSLSLSLLSPY